MSNKMKRFSIVVILFGTVFLSACKVGPNYKAPLTKVPTTWGETETKAVAQNVSSVDPAQVPVTKWWSTFEDPMLDSLVERAVVANLDLQFAQARVREARAQRGIIKADLYPTVNASASYQRSRNSENLTVAPQPGTGSPSIGLEGDFYQAGFDASWEDRCFWPGAAKYRSG